MNRRLLVGLCVAGIAFFALAHPDAIVLATPAAFGIGALLWGWPYLTKLNPSGVGSVQVYATLSRRLGLAARATRSLFAASLAVRGVGLRAALPIIGDQALRPVLAV